MLSCKIPGQVNLRSSNFNLQFPYASLSPCTTGAADYNEAGVEFIFCCWTTRRGSFPPGLKFRVSPTLQAVQNLMNALGSKITKEQAKPKPWDCAASDINMRNSRAGEPLLRSARHVAAMLRSW